MIRFKPMDDDHSTKAQPAPDSGMMTKPRNRMDASGDEASKALVMSPGKRRSERFQSAFLGSAALVLILAGLAKLASTGTNASAMGQPDPVVWFMTRRGIAGLSGLIEVLVGGAILFTRAPASPTLALGFLCALFLLYRAALFLVGEPIPCGCLGEAAPLLGLTDSQASSFATLLLAYLCLGTAACMVLSRFHRVTAHGPTQGHAPGEPNVP
jgi:hypothetical protein